MSDATDLWDAVEASYDEKGLISLTNVNTNSATTIDTAVAHDAAQDVINLWPVYAQEDYDGSAATHVTVAKEGVIAVLWRRGGTAASIARVHWDEVFSPDGMISRIRRVGPRGRKAASSNSGVRQSSERLSDGSAVRPWSDPQALPSGRNYLPNRRSSVDD